MIHRLALAAALAVLALALASPSLAAPKQGAAAPFPTTVSVDNGKVTIRKRPTRIVSLSPTATETLFAIGAGDQVVAVDDQSNYPKRAPHTSLSGFTPNVEAIAALDPDLVVIAFDPKGLSGALERLGIPVVFQNAAPTIPAAYRQIRQLGKITGHAQEAKALAARMSRTIRAIVDKVHAKLQKASVYHELDQNLFSVTSDTFVGRVYAMFGLTNIADAAKGAGSDYPQLSAEFVVAANPDLIVLADTVCCDQTAQTVASRPGWSRVAAVRSGSIVRLDDSIASRWGPRLVNLVRAVGTALLRLGSQ
jgi:iron complex transport system substrate-binding protein